MPTQPYYVDGKRVPSVTTVLSRFKDSGGLINWAWNVSYEVLAEAVHVLESKDRTKIREFLKTKPLERGDKNVRTRQACNAGNITHDLVELWANRYQGREAPDPNISHIQRHYNVDRATVKQALNGYNAFLDWQRQSRLKIHATEVPLVHPEFKFGGCLDALVSLETTETVRRGKNRIRKRVRKLGVGDWKTSGAVYSDYLIQLAAYWILVDRNHEHTDIARTLSETRTKQVSGVHLARFDKEHGDFTHHHWTDLDDGKEMFLLLRQAYELDKQIRKRVK